MIQTKPQKQIALPPADELGARFCHWFSHPWHWIYAETPAPGQKAQWFTETRYPLQPRNLWREYLDSEKIIGLRFNNHETRYCLLDIDRGSPYHPANDRDRFKAALAALEAIGLCRPLIVRSSDSEGIHVYYFLPEAVPTFALACAIRFALEDAGCYLRSGHLEAFPNCKPYSKGIPTDYNGHRLPLQVGSYWLDDDGLPLGDDLRQFLDAADVAAAHQDIATLRRAIAAAGKSRRRLQYTAGVSNKAAEWKRHLEERIAEGWTGRGQTNELLLDFATYGIVFLSLSDDALINYIVETAKTAPGYQQYCGHQHNIRRRAIDWVKSAQKWYSPYRSYPKRDRSYQENFEQLNNIVSFENPANANRRQEAAERIQQAIAHLEATDMLPLGATPRAAAISATAKELFGTGISPTTLHKPYHLPLWHPGQQKSPEPSQGGILHAVLEVEEAKIAETRSESDITRYSLYEGVGADEGQPRSPRAASQPLVPPLEISSTPSLPSQDDCCCSRRDPSTDDWHNDCHTPTDRESGVRSRESADTAPTVPAAPTALTPPATPPAVSTVSAASEGQEAVTTASAIPQPISTPAAAPAAPKIPMPDDSSPETIRRLTRIHLAAGGYARKTVKMQELAAACKFDPAERSHRENVARMQYLWRSGEPLWMEEVKHWVARHPGSLPDIPPPVGFL